MSTILQSSYSKRLACQDVKTLFSQESFVSSRLANKMLGGTNRLGLSSSPMEQNQQNPEPKTVRDLILSNYFATIGSRGGKAGSRADKIRAGRLGGLAKKRQAKSKK